MPEAGDQEAILCGLGELGVRLVADVWFMEATMKVSQHIGWKDAWRDEYLRGHWEVRE
jgi:hypothetical protein